MVGFENLKAELDTLGVAVIAASTDGPDKAAEGAAGLSFPLGFGVTRELAESLGSWWEERRGIIQPSEFIIDATGRILASSYSDGPLGRIDATDVVKFIRFREAQAK